MEYDFRKIEAKWQRKWADEGTYRVEEDASLEKFYVLDMFPYPSGAGLHVGHPLGYIASDVIARYKTLKGFNVLHPMGYDSFGLPAEQYAIQTGQHPAVTTENNIARYRKQLERIGFNYDWSRELRTSDPKYYKWTQWFFKELYNSWYNLKSNRAEPIDTLVDAFTKNGSYAVEAAIKSDWYKALDLSKFFFGQYFVGEFTATDWKAMNAEQQEDILTHYRLAFLSDTWVNWCQGLGTVLANDEIKDGLSERGGYPVEQRLMKQWSLRITAYAERLLTGLENLDWSDSIKEIQRNWIGKSRGASVSFSVDGMTEKIEVFTTRPDTIFGVSFMVLAPEHPLVAKITTPDCREQVDAYVKEALNRTERDRQSDVKNVTGTFTGSYALHPFTGSKTPVWISDYVLAGYGTGAIMAVPAGDQRDFDFARKFDLTIPEIFEGQSLSDGAYSDKQGTLKNSSFLTGMSVEKATEEIIEELEKKGVGYGKTNYRLRDAIFSRQRYWGEPFPVYYENDQPRLLEKNELPLTLPKVDKYLPTDTGKPPLARAGKADWSIFKGDRMECNTMPGWAGSSWYFIRYMDPNNAEAFADQDKIKYWKAVDLYIGGAEHATGHLLYARFWTKFLFDRGFIGFDEPFQKMINQGMILGRSSLVYRLELNSYTLPGADADYKLPSTKAFPEIFVTREIYEDWLKDGKVNEFKFEVEQCLRTSLKSLLDENLKMNVSNVLWEYGFIALHVDISLVNNDVLDTDGFRAWRTEYENAEFIRNTDGVYHCGFEIEKMSKRWFNVVTPDALCEEYGADTLRMYEMFLGPVEQSKPWDTQGISGVHNFLRKFWRLFFDADGQHLNLSEGEPSKAELKTLHKTIKKITEDLDRLSWNTVVSACMIAVNELTVQKCNNREVLEKMLILVSPYAPHFAEELWEKIGHETTITRATWPEYNEAFLKDADFDYPVSFNGKVRFKILLPADFSKEEVEKAVLATSEADKYLGGKPPKKVIVVPKRIINLVV